ncbi:sensor histidine kinase [Lichenicoccus sp.]|uniref:sensor histidine kinase n=1 Tax=Lichenicoccus sp. TaxID=2781899 RepID=UPI003D14C32C
MVIASGESVGPRRRGSALAAGAVPATRRLLGNLLGTVSTRMIAVILLSSVPLALLSGLVSWHSYQSVSGYSNARAEAMQRLFRDRARQDLEQGNRFLAGVSRLGELNDPSQCGAALRVALATQDGRYSALVLFDAAGHRMCAAGAVAGPAPQANTMAARRTGYDLAGDAPGGGRDITMQISHPGGQAGPLTLIAETHVGWSRDEIFGGAHQMGFLERDWPVRAWLFGGGLGVAQVAVPLCIDCGWTAPPDLVAMRVRAEAGHGDAVGWHGTSLAITRLATNLDVLTITQPTREEAQALSTFIMRVIGIVLVLGVGLIAVAVGANRLVVTPLQELTGAVLHWRRAGDYQAREIRYMPMELHELSHAFTQATRSLARHEDDLREAETKQALLIKEIHHRVKNNLQIIASLLNLQANRIRQPEARAEFASARDRVRALATLHRYLYSEGELQTLNMRSFLHELCGQLFQAIGEREGRRIRLEIEAPELAMSTDQAVPLSLVVTEAVSNAVKYAFPDGRSGHVRVSLAPITNGRARLAIEDDGVGIPAGRVETETGIRDGLGIQLIRGFARQLGAQLDVQEGWTREGGGTRYVLVFSLNPEASEAEQLGEDVDAGAR